MKIATPLIIIASMSRTAMALTHLVNTRDGKVVNNTIAVRASGNVTNSTNEIKERSNMLRRLPGSSFHPCLGSFTYVLPQCCTYGEDKTVPLHCGDRESFLSKNSDLFTDERFQLRSYLPRLASLMRYAQPSALTLGVVPGPL
jgi:hypothetical protein